MNSHQEKVAFFLPSLEGGGAERVVVNLIKEFVKREIKVELVLANTSGPYLIEVSQGVKVFDLKSARVLFALPKLIKYLKTEKPDILVSSLSHANIIAILANKLAKTRVRILVREDTTLSLSSVDSVSFKTKIMPLLMKIFYRWADLIIAVSKGVKDDLVSFAKLPSHKIEVIYNPVITPELFTKAKESVDHPWFSPNSVPIILGAGRLTKAKDFPTLLKAFALVRKEIDSRLVILGEGEERKNLEKLAKELGIEGYLWMPGFVDNPYKYMSKASVFVLSSIYEGLPTVLIEALALGCQVVSTDCKSGPREILDDGKSGKLVPAGNYKELAHAIKEILTYNIHYNIDKSTLEKYTLRYSSEEYLKLIFGEVG